MGEFPKTLEAVKRHEKSSWAIADAVLSEIGPARVTGKKDGSLVKFDECSEFLAQEGFQYSANTLRKYRRVAECWPKDKRLGGWSFWHHQLLKSPKVAAEFVAQRKSGDPPGEKEVREFLAKRDGTRSKADKSEWTKFLDCIDQACNAAKLAQAIVNSGALKDRDPDGPIRAVIESWEKVVKKEAVKA